MSGVANRPKRLYRRRTVRIAVEYLSDAGLRCERATTLGAGGLFIETDSPESAGSILKLRFQLSETGTLLYKGEVLGVLAIYSRIPMDLVSEGTVWLRMVANHAAIAIANVRAFEEIERLKKQLELESR